jgi:phosphoenolpyruvate carboxykinase (GTP)
MGSYMAHWLTMPARTERDALPRIYGVNWFRKDADGTFLWPGFGDNARVLEWICRRLDGDPTGETTPIGVVPTADDLDTEGLDVPPDALAAALAVDPDEWTRELPGIRDYLAQFADRLPPELLVQLDALESRLG